MDPDEALATLRVLLADEKIPAEAREQFEALDGWLSAGGFPPQDWRRTS